MIKIRKQQMTDEQIQDLINMNYRVLTLLGIATAFMMELQEDELSNCAREKYQWFVKAIQDVIYLNKPLPEMP